MLTLLAAGPTRAAADDFQRYLASAARLLESGDFERALEQLRAARQQPHGADDDVRVSLYEGIVLSRLGRDDDAGASFRAALSLDPDAKLPVESPPEVAAALEAQRQRLRKPSPPVAPKLSPQTVVKRSRVLPIALVSAGAAVAVSGIGALSWAWVQHGAYAQGDLTRAQARSANVAGRVGVAMAAVGGATLAAGVVVFLLPEGARLSLAPARGGAWACLSVPLP
jgi:tetratricopeptide (TPR) repeat protein